jgi:hypothetical protein
VGQATLFVQNGIQTAELQDYTTWPCCLPKIV